MTLTNWIQYLNKIPCWKCGKRCNTHFVPTVKMDYTTLEGEDRCCNCQAVVNYWVTGYYENPNYYDEKIKLYFENIIYKIKNIKKEIISEIQVN